MEQYQTWILEKLQELTAIDSPTGFTGRVTDYLVEEYQKMGYEPVRTYKGGILIDLGGTEKEAVLTASHVDTLGAVTS